MALIATVGVQRKEKPPATLIASTHTALVESTDRNVVRTRKRQTHRSRCVCLKRYICIVTWTVDLHETFAEELAEMDNAARAAILEQANVLEEYGSQLGRPYVDTLNGSAFSNMKELRC